MWLDSVPPGAAFIALIGTLLGSLLLMLGLAFRPPLSYRLAPVRWVATDRRAAVVVTGLVGLWVALLVHRLAPYTPVVTDEFAYLLASQTFAEGRLTNPQHSLWRTLQAEHILDSPSYMAKYPPAQGLALAAGRVAFGDPWWGVWIPFACGAAAVCWMLQAWTSARWAFLGGLMTAVHPAMHNHLTFDWHTMHLFSWTQSFWGGGVAMLGSALFLGGVRRMAVRLRPWPCFWTCAGLVILANSRPFEGLLVAAPTLAFLLYLFARRVWIERTETVASLLGKLAGPTLIPLAVAMIGMAEYNRAVTGSWHRFPYVAYEHRHTLTPLFWWQPRRAVSHDDLAVMVWDYSHFQHRPNTTGDYATWKDVLAVSYDKIQTTTSYFFGMRHWYLVAPFLLLVGGATLAMAKGAWDRLAIAACVVFVAGVVQSTYYLPHYAAPVYPLLLYLWCRFLRVGSLPGRRGSWPRRLVAAGFLVWWIARFLPVGPAPPMPSPIALRQELERQGGRHLVLVAQDRRGAPGNEADIDRSRVVFARSLSDSDDARLIHYFKDRTVWRTGPDYRPVPVRPSDGSCRE
jgi:hypothetical protein